MTAMKNQNASQLATALVEEAVDVLQRAAKAPDAPVNDFQPAKERRELRRLAMRLRQGKARPRYRNLHTSDQLADICERTVQRDEILEEVSADFLRITRDLERVAKGNEAEVGEAVAEYVMKAQRSAEELGPGSEAAERLRCLESLSWLGDQYHRGRRRQKVADPARFPLAADPTIDIRNRLTAAEILDSVPPSEAVIAIPPEGTDSGRGRILIRIGLDEASWIGSVEIGSRSDCTILMMPGD